MPISLESKKIYHKITNEDFGNVDSRCSNHDMEIRNYDLYAYPFYHHRYETELKDLDINLYIMNAHPIIGTFENITFKSGSFFDCSIFRHVTFINCNFEDVDIRWTRFEDCKFLNCKGTIRQARRSTWTKDCEFINSEINIDSIDEFIWFKGKRTHKYCDKFILK